MTMPTTALVWFRRDLRLADHPALQRALAEAARIVPVYLHCPAEDGDWQRGAASNWWLHHSLAALDASLTKLGSRLVIRRGDDSLALLDALIAETGAGAVFWNRIHEPAAIARDTRIKAALRGRGLIAESGNAALLHAPQRLQTGSGGPYKVFTPFWKALLAAGIDQAVAPAPSALPPLPDPSPASIPLATLGLLPERDWAADFPHHWQPGEAGAAAALRQFLDAALGDYAEARDRPAAPATSRLSPHLHFGEIGPRQIVRHLLQQHGRLPEFGGKGGLDRFAAELGWREFAQHLLFHFPATPNQPLNPRFAGFPWRADTAADLAAWQRGTTGVPLVDAGMRELWRTGWMHNRVRMVVASFLVKNLLIPWQLGARWFWDTLVDADLASNTLGWQWCAGCGADAAPYFRVFNPVLQSEKFDPDGAYLTRWLPELASLPAPWRHKPWATPAAVQVASGFVPGRDYPLPIVDLGASRARALAAFATLGSK